MLRFRLCKSAFLICSTKTSFSHPDPPFWLFLWWKLLLPSAVLLAPIGPQSCQGPRSLPTTEVWVHLSWYIMGLWSLSAFANNFGFWQRLKDSKPQSEPETSYSLLVHQVAGIPSALLCPSWSWEAHVSVASCPGSTSLVCPAMAAPHSPLHHLL